MLIWTSKKEAIKKMKSGEYPCVRAIRQRFNVVINVEEVEKLRSLDGRKYQFYAFDKACFQRFKELGLL